MLRSLFLLKPLSAWMPPSSVTSHVGDRFPDHFQFFADPGDVSGRILTAEANVTVDSDHPGRALFRILIGASYGAAWGVVGVWLCEIEASITQWILIAATAGLMARENYRGLQDAYITFVSEEGMGIVTIRCDARAKHFLPHMTKQKCYLFSQLAGGRLVGNEIKFATTNGDSNGFVTMRRPARLPVDHWQRWFHSGLVAFEDIRYSKSLSDLPNINRRCCGLRNPVHRTAAVSFQVTSVLGERVHSGPEFFYSPNGGITRLPVGRLGFCEEGLVIENWVPLFEPLIKSDLCVEGLEFILWGIEPLDGRLELNEVISAWEADHVTTLSLETIESISEEKDSISIKAKDGRVFEFLRDQVVGYTTFLRLVQSSIWSYGIDHELRLQVMADIERLRDFGDFTDSSSQVFGSQLPKHRAMIWYAAFRLRLHIRVSNDVELQLKERAFVDCLRVLPGCEGMGSYLMQCYLDSGRSVDDSSNVDVLTEVFDTPEPQVNDDPKTDQLQSGANEL